MTCPLPSPPPLRATLVIAYGTTAVPCCDTAAKARVMSIRRTSDDPSTIDGRVLIGVVMPKRCAMSAMVSKPTSSPSLAATVLTDRAKASRTVIDPEKPRVLLRGVQPDIVTGESTTTSSGL